MTLTGRGRYILAKVVAAGLAIAITLRKGSTDEGVNVSI
jgi:hypothetical protein